jgi:type IV pilus assembly protein PilW
MRATKPDRIGNRGFSIVEIMVGLAIGLISMLIVMQVFTTFEGQKRTTTSGADAQTNGGFGLFSMERDIRMAGYGFNAAVGCTLQTAQALPAPFSNALLVPVRVDKAAGLPDTITLLSSNKSNWSVPTRYVPIPPATPPQFAPANTIGVTSTIGIAAGDLMLAYQNTDCTLFQVNSVDTTDPANPFIVHDAVYGTVNWNGAIAGSPTYTSTAQLMDLGNLAGHGYKLDDNGNLVFSSYCAASNGNSACPASDNTATSQTIATDIVNLKAQYGFDMHADPRTSVNVDRWSDAMVDADGSGTIGDIGDIRRLYALRVALVARSGLKEKPNPASGVCDTTAANPTWAGGTIDISRNTDGTANPDWQCYRYKTFETVIPLRNLIW